MERNYNVLAASRDGAADFRGHLLDCGHYLAEERPAETADAIEDFFLD